LALQLLTQHINNKELNKELNYLFNCNWVLARWQ
jgi:hypothetical protein